MFLFPEYKTQPKARVKWLSSAASSRTRVSSLCGKDSSRTTRGWDPTQYSLSYSLNRWTLLSSNTRNNSPYASGKQSTFIVVYHNLLDDNILLIRGVESTQNPIRVYHRLLKNSLFIGGIKLTFIVISHHFVIVSWNRSYLYIGFGTQLTPNKWNNSLNLVKKNWNS